MDRNIKPGRLAAMAVVLLLFVGGYLLNLYKLQIVEGAAYYEMSQNNIVSTRTVTAARGNILDRYGRVLVSNRSCNNLTINSTELFQDDLDSNAVILQLCNTLTACGDTWIDELPITMEAPFEYVDNMTDVQRMTPTFRMTPPPWSSWPFSAAATKLTTTTTPPRCASSPGCATR